MKLFGGISAGLETANIRLFRHLCVLSIGSLNYGGGVLDSPPSSIIANPRNAGVGGIYLFARIYFGGYLYVSVSPPSQSKNNRNLKFETQIPLYHLCKLLSKKTLRALASENCRVTWISAYLLDFLVLFFRSFLI